jgi:hypothetical protein
MPTITDYLADFEPPLSPEDQQFRDLYLRCTTIGEVLQCVYQLQGLGMVRELLTAGSSSYTRRDLRKAEAEIKRAGMSELAQVVAEGAKAAKAKEPMSFARRLELRAKAKRRAFKK